MTPQLRRAAVYEREVGASLERVWENVHDWEHLPWLHAQAFRDIELLDSGAWGWRARVQIPPREAHNRLLIELRREADAPRYHTRTLEGPGAGSDIRTTLSHRDTRRTHVRVEFWLPEAEEEQLRAAGAALVKLYTLLWDQDEAMMRRRQAFLDGELGSFETTASHAPVFLGPMDSLREKLPCGIEVGERHFWLREHADEVFAHPALCPHLGGPLDEAEIRDGYLVCPWHGYRFSLADGRNPDGRPCSLGHGARVEVSETGDARLVFGKTPSP